MTNDEIDLRYKFLEFEKQKWEEELALKREMFELEKWKYKIETGLPVTIGCKESLVSAGGTD